MQPGNTVYVLTCTEGEHSDARMRVVGVFASRYEAEAKRARCVAEGELPTEPGTDPMYEPIRVKVEDPDRSSYADAHDTTYEITETLFHGAR